MTAKQRGGGVYLVALDELEDCVSADSSSTEDTEALRTAINSFLDSLTKEDRILFMGRYFAMESIQTLAARNGVTKNTINVRLSRIRKKLKNWLEERSIFI